MPDLNTQYCWPSRPASAIVGPRNLRRWELKILPHEKPESFHDPARVREVLANYVDTDAIELWRSAVYRFHALVASEWRRDRIFLLGDSAHQTPPFMGQGMCAGIRDAANLVWKLLLVEKAGASATLLDTYQAERKIHVQNVVAHAKELGLIIGELDLEAAKARDARLRAERARGVGETVRHRLIPPLTQGLIDRDERGQPTTAAGTVFPQPRVETPGGKTALLDDLLPSEFLVVSATIDPQVALGERELAALRRINGVRLVLRSERDPATTETDVVAMTTKDAVFANWLAETGAVAAVVRPDRYVYGIARTSQELVRLVRALSRTLLG